MHTFKPRSKLSSDPRDMIPCMQYTVSGIPNGVLKSASISLGSVRSALMVDTCSESVVPRPEGILG